MDFNDLSNSTLLETLEGCEVRLFPGNVLHYIAKAAIDGDGDPDNVYHDLDWQYDTSLHQMGMPINSAKVPYSVLPLGLLNLVKPIGLGSLVHIKNLHNGCETLAVVADLGPRKKIGEISEECARRLGIPASAVSGGDDAHEIEYTVYLGTPACIDGVTYPLQPLGA